MKWEEGINNEWKQTGTDVTDIDILTSEHMFNVFYQLQTNMVLSIEGPAL